MTTLYCIGPQKYSELFISEMISELEKVHVICSRCINKDADYSIIGVDNIDDINRIASGKYGIIDMIGADSIAGIPMFRISRKALP